MVKRIKRFIALVGLALAALVLGTAPTPAQTPAAPPKTILFFGDSLTAGYGLDDPATLAFPGLIQAKIDEEKLPFRVVNAGLSGETTAGGLRRLDWILRQPIAFFVLELGGNDGLRGLAPSVARQNLEAIISKVRARNPDVQVILAGMQMPTSMGVYAEEFAQIYPAIAEKSKVTLIPFLLDGVGGRPELNLPDGIHPTAQGHTVVATTVWSTLGPLLRSFTPNKAPSTEEK